LIFSWKPRPPYSREPIDKLIRCWKAPHFSVFDILIKPNFLRNQSVCTIIPIIVMMANHFIQWNFVLWPINFTGPKLQTLMLNLIPPTIKVIIWIKINVGIKSVSVFHSVIKVVCKSREIYSRIDCIFFRFCFVFLSYYTFLHPGYKSFLHGFFKMIELI